MDSDDADSPTAYLNDVKVANVEDPGSYTYVYVWPGKYHVRAHPEHATTNRDDPALDIVIPTTGNYYLLFGDPGEPACGHRFMCRSLPIGEHEWQLVPEAAARLVLKYTRYMPAYAQTVGHQ